MRIIGKTIVILSGVVLSVSLALLTLVSISSQSSPIVYTLIVVFIMYVVGLLSSIFANKQRLLFISIVIFIAYFMYEVGPINLYQEPSQFTYTIALMLLMLIGMLLSKKRRIRHN